ncbi:MAG: P-II family nitrogen regulator [Chromatiales bacterium]|nr:P-II family nitrogen regulator [Chromatiales bacterium]
MRFKLLIALVQDERTEAVLQAAREAGATGATVITSARGEGLEPTRSFLGLSLETPRDVVMLLVEEHRSRAILEHIAQVARFDADPGSGIAFQIAVEDAVGISQQMNVLLQEVEDEL